MKNLVAVVILALAAACGGSSSGIDIAGTWKLTDSQAPGSTCPTASATETITVVKAGDGFTISGYQPEGSYCDQFYCEMYASSAAGRRDLTFHDASTGEGSRAAEAGCTYYTTATRQ